MQVFSLRQAFEPVLRRCFHLYWRFSRPMTLGVRAVVLDDQTRVFLVKHSYVAGWHLPGGGVEAGETLIEALRRELLEEGNIIPAEEPELFGLYYNSVASRRDHVAVFVVRRFSQPGAPQPGREIIAHGFYPLDGLPEDTTAGTRARLAEVVDGEAVTGRW